MPELDLRGSGRNPRGHRSKSASKRHGRDGNEDSRRRADDGSRGRPREHAASIAGSGAQRGGGRGRWDDHGRTARPSARAMGAAQEATPGGDLSAAACAAGGYPKAGGRDRMLGIPTVVDRLIQQAMHQVIARSGNRTSPTIVTGFGPDEERIRRWKPPGLTSSRDAAGWSISTWRSFSTGSTTTC